MVTLRPATDGEEPFLLRVYASTRTEELAQVPWTEDQKQAFLESQFRAQHLHYHREYPGADYLVVEKGGERIGRLYVDRTPGEIHLIDIALLQEHRGLGIGSGLLRDLVNEADATGRSIRLWVEPFNPAKRLYDRLGFAPVGVPQGVYQEMVRGVAKMARVS